MHGRNIPDLLKPDISKVGRYIDSDINFVELFHKNVSLILGA
jgi:hypothetical protein